LEIISVDSYMTNMKITGLSSLVSSTSYSCKTFYIKATCTTSSCIIITNCEESEKSTMTSSEAFYINNMSLSRHLKPELSANH
jgi:hypothetical protein